MRKSKKKEWAKPSRKQSLRKVWVGKDVYIADFVNAYECKIGKGSKIGAFVEIQRGAVIGQDSTISSHSFVCEGVTIEDRVFVGHGVMFINDKNPRATNPDGSRKTSKDWKLEPVLVKHGASIGSNATILGGVIIGEYAVVGAGAVVTKDVPPGTTVVGVPARPIKQKRTQRKRRPVR